MFTMVMMTALSGSPDAVQFGGRNSCDGGGMKGGFLGGLFNRGGRGGRGSGCYGSYHHAADCCGGPVAHHGGGCYGGHVSIPAVPDCCGHGHSGYPSHHAVPGATPVPHAAPGAVTPGAMPGAAPPAAMPGTAPTPTPATTPGANPAVTPDKPATPPGTGI